jgi:hypothetical protein
LTSQRAITIETAIQKRSHEPICKTDTKKKKNGLKATFVAIAKLNIVIIILKIDSAKDILLFLCTNIIFVDFNNCVQKICIFILSKSVGNF